MSSPVDVIPLADASSPSDAFGRHRDRDVVLCFEGAAPPREVIDALAACEQRERSVGSVIPFPAREVRPGGRDFFAEANSGEVLEVPSARPPCIFIPRRALEHVGYPAGANLASILAFCDKASRAGLRHLLCADAQVAVSPNDDAAWRDALAADAALAAAWSEFDARAPMTPLERRADLARLRASPRPRLLFVTHDWGGGVERHVRDLARLLGDDCEVVALRPGVSGSIQVEWLREGETLAAWFDSASEWALCRDFVAALGISRVHFHHIHGLPQAVLDLPGDLGVPFDFTLHDHYPMCPQYHLADIKGRYCGEPAEEGCRRCLAERPPQWPLDIVQWRSLFGTRLRQADRVIVPSTDLEQRTLRYFPDVKPLVLPHPELSAEAPRLYKVLVLGGLSAIKGMDLFEACVRDAQARELPLHFHVLGHLSRPLETSPEAPVTVSGSYRDTRLASLVALERPDGFLFLSQVPETYSYTLSVAMRASKPIVATRLGAFIERLRGYPGASLVAHDAAAAQVNDALMQALRARPAVAPARPFAASAD